MTEPDPTPDPSNWRSYVWPSIAMLAAGAFVVVLVFAISYIT